ncbi:MAG: hypothetical protein HRU41_32900 [Saprospiraceae bacterium]|nr:hypothetical protein [Saprospiraceae bacterium]
MKLLRLSLLLLISTLSNSIVAQEHEPTPQKTWVYTYIKATDNQRSNLKKYIEKNWFVMDSIAVQRGLFNNYQLLENVGTEEPTTWDFIVAVEYFTARTYSDIQDLWQEIRRDHKTILIDGKDFNQLGQIVKSEQLVTHSYSSTAKK